MKQDNRNPKSDSRNEQQDPAFRQRTNLPGQNPRANDDPSHDQNNDENRQP